MASSDIKRYLANWQGEVDSAIQYQALAKAEKNQKLSKVYMDLARVEEKHRDFWEAQIIKAGGKVPARKPSWRARFLIGIARIFGPRMALSTIAEGEKADRNLYAPQPETNGTPMVLEEHGHDLLLGEILNDPNTPSKADSTADLESRHKNVEGNTLRASVMGANDGLCSNLSLVMGVAGATINNHVLLLTGMAGLLAGACSMALGEWLSVTSSRELAEREIKIEEEEFQGNPEGEMEELKLIYESKGMSTRQAAELAQHMLSDKNRAVETLVREELGIDIHDKGGSPAKAAIFSFLLFALGAFIPVFPFLLVGGKSPVVISIIMGSLGLFGFGALGTLFTGKPVWYAGLRQLILGLLAAGITFSLGRILGLGLGS